MRRSGLLPVLATSIKQFKPSKQTLNYAAIIAEAMHIVLKTYEMLSAMEGGNFRVRRKGIQKQAMPLDDPQVKINKGEDS